MDRDKLINKKVVCADGFSMSVQANEGSYCEPRLNKQKSYNLVEVGYPSEVEKLILPWAERPERPTDTVYAYVPVHVVTNVIVKHGGIVEGQVPPGVIPIKSVERYS